MFSNILSPRKKHSIVITRVISEMEQMNFTMTTNDVEDFGYMVATAEDAAQLRADQFQAQLKAVAEAKAKLEAKAAKGSK